MDDNYKLKAKLYKNGNLIKRYNIRHPKIGPQKVVEIDVASVLPPKLNSLYHLNFEIILNKKTKWAEKGHTIAYEQFSLGQLRNKKSAEYKNDLKLVNDKDYILVCNKLNVKFSKTTGYLKQLSSKGKVLIEEYAAKLLASYD